MRKWIGVTIPLIIASLLWSFSYKPNEVQVPQLLKVNEPTEVLFPKNDISPATLTMFKMPPFLGASYIGFKEALAFKESSGNYFITNTLGYLGKYQFGIGTLQLMGVYNPTRFLNDPVLQEQVFHTNIARNKWILRKDIKRFVGKNIGGIAITESGMLAAAHLAGAGNVKKYLRSWGAYDVSDSYGTNIAKYMKTFSGYDTSHIIMKRNPKV